jgi:NhaP-type Na+/H+ or K+/H+ antiporter
MKLVSLCIPLSLIICIFFTFAGLSIKNYKEKTGLNIPCHESSIATIFGMAIGGAIFWGTGTPMFFDPDFFFYLVLPPIIFSAGYSLKRKRFFRYGGGIALFGIAGTIINFGIISFAAHAYQHVIVHDEVFDMSWTKAMLLGKRVKGAKEWLNVIS